MPTIKNSSCYDLGITKEKFRQSLDNILGKKLIDAMLDGNVDIFEIHKDAIVKAFVDGCSPDDEMIIKAARHDYFNYGGYKFYYTLNT